MIEAQALVEMAMARVGATTSAELAHALGLTSYSSPQRVSRWREGKNEPDYRATLRLLEIVGAINHDALRAAETRERAEVLKRRVREHRRGGGAAADG